MSLSQSDERHAGEQTTAGKRHIRAIKGILTGNLGRVLSFAYAAISVPLLLEYLGSELFGAWTTVRGFNSYLQTMGLGVSAALVFLVAHSVGADQRHKIKELVSSGFYPIVGLTLLVGAALTSALFVFFPADLFGLGNPEDHGPVRTVLLLLIWSMILSSIIGIPSGVRSGLQEEYKNHVWNIGGSFAAVVGLILGVIFEVRVEVLAALVFFLPVVARAFNAISIMRSHPEAIPSPGAVRWSSFKSLFSQGLTLTIAQIFAAILWSTDNLVIASALGAASVVPYAVTFTIVYTAFNAIHSITTSYGAAIRESFAAQDWQWLESSFRKILKIVMNLSGGAGVWMLFWGHDLLSLWVGTETAKSIEPVLVTMLALYLPLLVWNSIWSFQLVAFGRFRWLLVTVGFEATANLALSLWLVRQWGINGVALGTILPGLLISSWAVAWLVRSTTDSHLKPEFRWSVKHLLFPVAAVLVIGAVLSIVLGSASPLIRFLIGGMPTMAISLLITAIVGFDFTLEKAKRILQGRYGETSESGTG